MSVRKEEVTLRMTLFDGSLDRLEKIRIAGQDKTLGETVAKAIQLYEWYLQKKKDGLEVLATPPDLKGPFIEPVFGGEIPKLTLVR